MVAASLKKGESAFLCDCGSRKAQLLEGPILLDCLHTRPGFVFLSAEALKGLYNLSLGLRESDDAIDAWAGMAQGQLDQSAVCP